MEPESEFRQPDTYSRIRSLLTTLQLRIDLMTGTQGSDKADSAFLALIHQDIANLAELVREKRKVLRISQEKGRLAGSAELVRSA